MDSCRRAIAWGPSKGTRAPPRLLGCQLNHRNPVWLESCPDPQRSLSLHLIPAPYQGVHMPLAHSLARPTPLPPHSGLLGLVAFLMTKGGWQGVGVGVSGSRLPSMKKFLSPLPEPLSAHNVYTQAPCSQIHRHMHTHSMCSYRHMLTLRHMHTHTHPWLTEGR